MFDLFRRKKPPRDLLTAVCPTSIGISMAQIRRSAGVPPVLEWCEFDDLAPGDDPAAKLRSIVRARGLKNTRVTSVMSTKTYRMVQVDAPDVPDAEMAAALRFQLKDDVDFDVSDAVIEVFDAPLEVARGNRRRVYAVVAQPAEVKRRVDLLVGAGANLEMLDIPELALRNIAMMLPENVTGVVLLYLGRDTGVVVICRRGMVYLCRSISFGTGALPETAVHESDPETLYSWLDNVIIEIQRSIDYYEGNYTQPRVGALVLTPVNRDLTGAAEYLDIQLGLSTRFLDFNELIDMREPMSLEIQSKCTLAIGAALRVDETEFTDEATSSATLSPLSDVD